MSQIYKAVKNTGNLLRILASQLVRIFKESRNCLFQLIKKILDATGIEPVVQPV